MTQADSNNTASTPDNHDVLQEPAQKARSASSVSTPQSTELPSGITSAQAEQIISQLKSLKQNLFILTLIGGFFAFRAIVFHR